MAALTGAVAIGFGATDAARGQPRAVAGALKIAKAPTLSAAAGAKGTVTMCGGNGLSPGALEGFNTKYRAKDVKLRVVDVAGNGDPNDALRQLLSRRSHRCDLFFMDLDFVGEFAATGWLLDMTPVVKPRKADFIASTLATALYRDRYFGVPAVTGAGLLYYRTDRIATVPDTWQGVYDSARSNGGLVYQGGAYEGLTCDFLEIAWAAGGSLLSPDGRKSAIDSPANLRALQFMVDGIRTGATPSIVATVFDEYASHSAFFAGGPAYMRNWPYAYGLGQDTNLAGKFNVAMLPPFAGAGRAGVLGGLDLAISRYGRNRRGAVLAVNYLTSPYAQKLGADPQVANWPVLAATYDDPAVKAKLPFAATLQQAIETAATRPVTPKYHDISAAVYNNVHAALHGDVSPQDALKTADRQINRVMGQN